MSAEELVDLHFEHSQLGVEKKTLTMQISPDNSKQLFAAAHNPNAQLWMVPNADHVQSYKTEPVAYLEHVLTLFGKSLASK